VGEKETEKKTDNYEMNKTTVIVGVIASVGLLVLATRR